MVAFTTGLGVSPLFLYLAVWATSLWSVWFVVCAPSTWCTSLWSVRVLPPIAACGLVCAAGFWPVSVCGPACRPAGMYRCRPDNRLRVAAGPAQWPAESCRPTGQWSAERWGAIMGPLYRRGRYAAPSLRRTRHSWPAGGAQTLEIGNTAYAFATAAAATDHWTRLNEQLNTQV